MNSNENKLYLGSGQAIDYQLKCAILNLKSYFELRNKSWNKKQVIKELSLSLKISVSSVKRVIFEYKTIGIVLPPKNKLKTVSKVKSVVNKTSLSESNDTIDELIDENKRLKQYLNFAEISQFLKVSLKLTEKLKNNLDSNDLQEFQQLSKDVGAILGEENVLISDKEFRDIDNKINTSSEYSENMSQTSDKKYVEKSLNKSVNEIHTKCHSNEFKFVCGHEKCNFRTHNKQSFLAHLNNHKSIRDFVCNICGKGFWTNSILRGHIKTIHTNNCQPISCGINNCKKVFDSELKLRPHQKLCHSLSCDFPNCDFKCVLKSNLMSHKIKHSNDKPFVCDYKSCTFGSRHKYNVLEHAKLHTTPLKCSHQGCEKTFKFASALRRHSVVHLAVKLNCVWPGCEYQTLNQNALKSHMNCHKSERNFVCDWTQCGKRFKTKQYLDTHYKIHTNDKKYVCVWPGCEYRCISSSNLNIHIKQVHKKIKIGSSNK